MSIASQLKGLNLANLKMSNGKTYAQNLKSESDRLRNCIQQKLDEYLTANPPKIYERTGGLEKSLQVEDFADIKIIGNILSINLWFDENANHQSGDGIEGWDGNGETVNTAYLLNYGYSVKKDVWFRDIENFGFRKAANFVEDGIDEFNKSNILGIRIDVKKPSGYKV